MKKVFSNLNYFTLYERCLYASIAHAIMVGKFGLLSSEQSWDDLNYNFQNMEGVRGVVSFSGGKYICTIQNIEEYTSYSERQLFDILKGVDAEIEELAKNEALQYMLINHDGRTIPFITAAFWGNEEINYSNQTEKQLLENSEELILPFLYCDSDVKKYWKNYYEMTDEQIELAEEIFKRRISEKGRICLSKGEVIKLKKWFDDIDECIESFQELDIYL